MDFKNKVALITGAASGFGREIARQAAKQGMQLFLVDIDRPNLKKITEELKIKGNQVVSRVTDVTKESEVKEAVGQTMKHFKRIDLLVNSAGISVAGFIWDLPTRDWEWILHADVMSQVYAMKAVIPIMVKQKTRGDILNVSSEAGLGNGPTMPAYATSKFASVGLTEAVAYDLQAIKVDIHMHVFCPAFYNTNLDHSERHRSLQYTDRSDPYYTSKTFQKFQKATVNFLRNGASVNTVGPIIFQALSDNVFCITTHKGLNPFIIDRTKRLLAGRQPEIKRFEKHLPESENKAIKPKPKPETKV